MCMSFTCLTDGLNAGSCPPAHLRRGTALSTFTFTALQLRTALVATTAPQLQRRVHTQALNAGIPLPTSPETQNRWLLSTFPILRHQELISRVAWTLGVIAIVRLGVFTKLPYVDARFANTGTRSGVFRTAPVWLAVLLLASLLWVGVFDPAYLCMSGVALACTSVTVCIERSDCAC